MKSNSHIEERVEANILDNRWHTIEFLFEMDTLKLVIDRKETVIANSTYNTMFITDAPNDDAAILILGSTYSGCMLHGPGLNFSSSSIQNLHPIQFGPCPLMQGPCTENDDILTRMPSIDYCSHEPCMQKGICVSLRDTYMVILDQL